MKVESEENLSQDMAYLFLPVNVLLGLNVSKDASSKMFDVRSAVRVTAGVNPRKLFEASSWSFIVSKLELCLHPLRLIACLALLLSSFVSATRSSLRNISDYSFSNKNHRSHPLAGDLSIYSNLI